MAENGVVISLYLAIRAIKRGNRGVLALTILLIALMVILMNVLIVILGSVITMYYQQLVDYQYGHVIVLPEEKQIYIENASRLTTRLQRVPGVLGVSTRYVTGVTITNKKTGKSPAASLIAIDPEEEKTVTRYQAKIIDGDYLSAGDTDQILVGVQLAGHTDESKDKISSLGGAQAGDRIVISFVNGVKKEYRIKGVFQTDNPLNDAGVFITRDELDRVMPTGDKATSILIRGTENRLDPAYSRGLLYACLQNGAGGQLKTWDDKGKPLIEDSMGSMQKIEGLVTLVSLVVASVVIFVIIYINITDRRKQIAILKAIGIRRTTIVRDFLFQTLFLCSCGAVAGFAMLWLIVQYLNINPMLFNLGYIYPTVDYGNFVVSILLLYSVALVSGFIPARNVANEDILEAMRG